jgi:hypothetical protein
MIAVRHRAALASATLAIATAFLALPCPANAALPGFQVRVSAPGLFKAGANPKTVEAVVSTDTTLRCQKVRWSMLLRVSGGAKLDDVKVTRIENGGEFPLQSQVNGDTARLTDEQQDPGILCRGQTVTADYAISFAGDTAKGIATFQVQALNARNVELAQGSGTSQVAGTVAATPKPTPSKSPKASPSPSDSAGAAAADEATDDSTDPPNLAVQPTDATQAAASTGVPSLLGPGLIVGALCVFIGVGILLRLRLRSRTPKNQPLPTGFYSR